MLEKKNNIEDEDQIHIFSSLITTWYPEQLSSLGSDLSIYEIGTDLGKCI